MNAILEEPPATNLRAAPAAPLVTAITLDAPLLGIESARLALRCTENRLLTLIAAGEIEWAFDLRGKESSRACIRVFTQSVVKLQQARKPSNLRRNWRVWLSGIPAFDDVFSSIFRHNRPFIRGAELARQWGCGCSHITNLIDLNLLELLEDPQSTNQSRLLSRTSVARFMQQRRIH
jgi:hypothetical protein